MVSAGLLRSQNVNSCLTRNEETLISDVSRGQVGKPGLLLPLVVMKQEILSKKASKPEDSNRVLEFQNTQNVQVSIENKTKILCTENQ